MFTKVNEEDRFSINLGKLSRTENQMARNTVSGASSVIIPAGTKFYVSYLAFLVLNSGTTNNG